MSVGCLHLLLASDSFIFFIQSPDVLRCEKISISGKIYGILHYLLRKSNPLYLYNYLHRKRLIFLFDFSQVILLKKVTLLHL